MTCQVYGRSCEMEMCRACDGLGNKVIASGTSVLRCGDCKGQGQRCYSCGYPTPMVEYTDEEKRRQREEADQLRLKSDRNQARATRLKQARKLAYWTPLISTVGSIIFLLGAVVGPIMAGIAVHKTLQAKGDLWEVVPRAVITLAATAALVISLLIYLATGSAAVAIALLVVWMVFAMFGSFFGWLEGRT